MHCSSCKKNKPYEHFLDSSLISGIGRICMKCKGKPIKKRRRKSKKSHNKATSSTKSCRVCSTKLIKGINWAPSRVKKHDYICGSCHRGGKKPMNTNSSSLTSPKCPKCNSKMIKRYSTKYSRHFLGCSRFPACRGTRDL